MNTVVFDSIAQKEILIDKCNRQGLQMPFFYEYYSREYNDYTPKEDIVSLLATNAKPYKILIVMGTWCGDSKEQVPRFYKIADEIGLQENKIEIICVDKNKQALKSNFDLANFKIERVPTFIFLDGEIEFGRIVETPSERLEIDWLKIVEKNQ